MVGVSIRKIGGRKGKGNAGYGLVEIDVQTARIEAIWHQIVARKLGQVPTGRGVGLYRIASALITIVGGAELTGDAATGLAEWSTHAWG